MIPAILSLLIKKKYRHIEVAPIIKMKLFVIASLTTAAAAAGTTQIACSTPHLQVDVYRAKPFPIKYNASISLQSSPQAFTLHNSAREAVLVDAPSLDPDAEDVVKWIEETMPGKTLKYIYVTHGHVDHFGAFPIILRRYPGARLIATAGVIEHMKTQVSPDSWNSWLSILPNLTKPSLDGIVALPTNGRFFLDETEEFRAVSVGEGDTADSTVLHAPSIDLVVTGDVIYGRCYQYLAENLTPELRAQWLVSIERVRALKPKIVIPSHAQDNEGFGITHLEETEKYIKSFNKWIEKAKDWEDLENLARYEYPDRIGEYILRASAQAFFDISG